MKHRILSHVLCFAAVMLVLVASTLAGTAFVYGTADSYNHVVATAITGADYQMGGVRIAYATAKITSPSSRVAQSSNSHNNSVSVNTMLAMDLEDGEYVTQHFDPRLEFDQGRAIAVRSLPLSRAHSAE